MVVGDVNGHQILLLWGGMRSLDIQEYASVRNRHI